MITRWRLEPKPEDVDKYLRGELVEPKKQIVYYIDPATPRKWIPYLIQGVNDWNIAFEKAGWKNAIVAKKLLSMIHHGACTVQAIQLLFINLLMLPMPVVPTYMIPRSGEILESHINWYHNVMNLVRDWYFIQTAAVDPQARTMRFSDSLMGQLIRFVSSHEVGHTLGFRHNLGSSSTVPVDSLEIKNGWKQMDTLRPLWTMPGLIMWRNLKITLQRKVCSLALGIMIPGLLSGVIAGRLISIT